MPTIHVVSTDDELIRAFGSGFGSEYNQADVQFCRSIPSGFVNASTEFDLLVLDEKNTKINTLEKLKAIRKLSNVFLLVIASTFTNEHRKILYNAGATEVIDGASGSTLLVLAIESLHHYLENLSALSTNTSKLAASDKKIAFENLILDSSNRQIGTIAGKKIGLTATEFDLLALLVSQNNRVLSREFILTKLHGINSEVSDRAIDVLVAKTRRKLAEAGAPNLIETRRNAGYIFIGKIRTLDSK